MIDARTGATTAERAAAVAVDAADARHHELVNSPEARSLEALGLMRKGADQARTYADRLSEQAGDAAGRAADSAVAAAEADADIEQRLGLLAGAVDSSELARLGLPPLAPPELAGLDGHRSELVEADRASRVAMAAVEVCLRAFAAVDRARQVQETAEAVAAQSAGRAEEMGQQALAASLAERDAVLEERSATDAWGRALPDPGPALTAQTLAAERDRAHDAAQSQAAEAERAAVIRREQTATARRELAATATAANLPEDRDGLTARSERLRAITAALARAKDMLGELIAADVRAGRQRADVAGLRVVEQDTAREAAEAVAAAEQAAAAYDARQEALSATAAQLAAALAEAAAGCVSAKRQREDAVEAMKRIAGELARAEGSAAQADRAVVDAGQRRRGTEQAAEALHEAPGLITAATAGAVITADDWTARRRRSRRQASAGHGDRRSC